MSTTEEGSSFFLDKAGTKRRLVIPNSSETHDEEMRFAVPKPEDQVDVELLKSLDKVLFEKKTRQYLDRLVKRDDESVRRIQSSRYEIFVQSSFKGSTAFQMIAAKVSSKIDVKEAIIAFAKKQAAAVDQRFTEEYFKFNNFSLLVNYIACPCQAPHIDLLRPNVQFGMTITDRTPRTICYSVPSEITSAEDLTRAGWPAMPESLQTAMENEDTGIPKLLKGFGNVLHPQLKESQTNLLTSGTLAALPGSIVHAGPSWQEHRAILFFSGHPVASDTPEYNPDTQYFSPILCADMVINIWSIISVNDRIYLLTRMLEYMEKLIGTSGVECFSGHLSESSSCSHFVKDVETRGLLQNYTECEDFTRRFAETNFVVCPKINGKYLSFTELTLVSVPNMYIFWNDGSSYLGSIYTFSTTRRSAEDRSSVLIYYESDRSWEGCEGGGYTLIQSTFEAFDGENGTLLDSEGDPIVCKVGNNPDLSRVDQDEDQAPSF